MSAPPDPLEGNPKYQKIADLNSGSFGFVLLARHKQTGENVAVKCIERGSKITKYVEREIIIHRCLWHPHIVEFKEVFLTPHYLCIVMEFAAGGDMFAYVVNRRGLQENEARWFFQQLIIGVDYCHRRGVVSRDIKLENTLLDGSQAPLLKLCDFGYAKHEQNHSRPKSKVGTPGYTAPEVISNKREYDGKKADIWSCGVMLYTMLFARYPFERPSDRNLGEFDKFQKILQRILKVDYELPPDANISPSCKNLLEKILVADPDKRTSLRDIQKHPWYSVDLPEEAANFNDTIQPPVQGLQSEEEIHRILAEAKFSLNRTASELSNDYIDEVMDDEDDDFEAAELN